jgi:redox-sensitive bicupin YhaK (pirin superfamily)
MFGIQSWVALPENAEENFPEFRHHDPEALPEITDRGVQVRLITGELFGRRSPVAVYSDTVYADALLQAGASFPLDPSFEERAIYIVSGEIEIAGDRFAAPQLIVFRPGDAITVRAATTSRMMILGGARMDSHRYIGGTSCPRGASGSRRRAATGKLGASTACRAKAADEFIPAPPPVRLAEPKPVSHP